MGDVCRTGEDLTLTVSTWVGASGIREELDAVATPRDVEVEVDHHRAQCLFGALDHGEVEQLIGRARVDIAGVVGGDTIGTQVDAETSVGVDRVGEDHARGSGPLSEGNTTPTVVGDDVGGTGADAANDRSDRPGAGIDPVTAVPESTGSGRIGTDEVAQHLLVDPFQSDAVAVVP